jgi:hypothetical protein
MASDLQHLRPHIVDLSMDCWAGLTSTTSRTAEQAINSIRSMQDRPAAVESGKGFFTPIKEVGNCGTGAKMWGR